MPGWAIENQLSAISCQLSAQPAEPSLSLEKKPAGGAAHQDPARVRGRERDDAGRSVYRCAGCGFAITTERARIEIGGAHQHDFMNPAGFAFRIACFSDAPGCRRAGGESTEWAWFPGTAWRIALCGSCFGHLGWSFRGASENFYGLIVDKIVLDEQTD